MLGKVATHSLFFLVFWNICSFSFWANRKTNSICDILPPCCHAVAWRFEIFHCWSPVLWSHHSAGFLAVTQTTCSPVLQVGALSWEHCPLLPIHTILSTPVLLFLPVLKHTCISIRTASISILIFLLLIFT